MWSEIIWRMYYTGSVRQLVVIHRPRVHRLWQTSCGTEEVGKRVKVHDKDSTPTTFRISNERIRTSAYFMNDTKNGSLLPWDVWLQSLAINNLTLTAL